MFNFWSSWCDYKYPFLNFLKFKDDSLSPQMRGSCGDHRLIHVAVTVKLEFGNVNINVNFFTGWENYFSPYFPYDMQHCTWIWPNSDRCLLNCFLVVACSEAFAEETREYNVDRLSHHETLRNCVCICASVNSTPGYCGASVHLVSPGGSAFANFALPGGWAFANPGHRWNWLMHYSWFQ